MAVLSDQDRDRAAWIVALFSALIHGWFTRDFAEAAQARDELYRLGVSIRIRRQDEKGAHHE
jgi:hypothetical protein